LEKALIFSLLLCFLRCIAKQKDCKIDEFLNRKFSNIDAGKLRHENYFYYFREKDIQLKTTG